MPADVARLFDVVGKIGEGTYGVVYLARSRAPQPCLLAVKTFKPGKVRAIYHSPLVLRVCFSGIVLKFKGFRVGVAAGNLGIRAG